MAVLKLIFSIVLHLAVSIPAHCSNLNILQRTFKLQTNNSRLGLLPLDAPWNSTSVSDCASTCLSHYPDGCYAFQFNILTGACTPGSPATSDTSTTTATGDLLFYDICDQSKGFRYVVIETARACLAVLGMGNYSVAEASCLDLGAVLMSVKTPERLDALVQLAQGRSTWVGCDDLAQKYTYRWKVDGSVLTNQTIADLFTPGDPHYSSGEDCVCLSGDTGKLADYTCSLFTYYACEIVI